MKMSDLRKQYIDSTRNQLVVQSNDLVQRSVLNLTAEEKRIIAFLVSKIRPEDTGFNEIPFSVKEFTDICGIDLDVNKSASEYIQETLKGLATKVIVFTNIRQTISYGPLTMTNMINWFHHISASKERSLFFVRFHDDLVPHLLQLRERFTAYQLRNILAMNSKYSSRLYELLRSYEWRKEPVSFLINDLKELLGATTYGRFPDFRRYVLEIAITEINNLSDLNVSYSTRKEGKRIAWIEFDIRLKTDFSERYQMMIKQDQRLRPDQIPGQISFDEVM